MFWSTSLIGQQGTMQQKEEVQLTWKDKSRTIPLGFLETYVLGDADIGTAVIRYIADEYFLAVDLNVNSASKAFEIISYKALPTSTLLKYGLPKKWIKKPEIETLFSDKSFSYIEELNKKISSSTYAPIISSWYQKKKDSELDVYITTNEAKNSFADILLGYDSNNGFVGRGELELKESLAPLSTFYLSFDRLSQQNSLLYLSYSKLHSQKWWMPTFLSFDLQQRGTIYNRLEARLAKTFFLQYNSKLSLGINIANSTIQQSSSINASLVQGTERLAGWYIELDRFSSVFDRWLAKEGLFGLFTYKQFRKQIESKSDQPSINENGHFISIKSMYQKLWTHRLVSQFRVHSYKLLGYSSFGPSDLQLDGGIKNIRGYIENQFLADSKWQMELEQRALIAEQSYVILFALAGQIQLQQNLNQRVTTNTMSNNTQIKTLRAAGFGLSTRTNNSQLTFLLSVSTDTPIDNPRIHIGYRTYF